MEFLRSSLRRHLAGKLVVASPNVGCFPRLAIFGTEVNAHCRREMAVGERFECILSLLSELHTFS